MSERMTTCYAFLDCNVLLHYQFFDEIDWPVELGADKVVLVFVSQVLSELDKQKRNPQSARSRDRAQRVVSKLSALTRTQAHKEARPDVELCLSHVEPRVDWKALDLDQSWADDRIVAAILSSPYPSEQKVLVSADLNLQLKAKARDIGVHELRGDLALRPERSDEELETARLRRELDRLKSRLPVLALGLKTDQGPLSVLHVTPQALGSCSDGEIESAVKKKRSALLPSEGVTTFKEFARLQGQYASWRFDQYRQAVLTYLSGLEKYLRQLNRCAEVIERTVILELVLCNRGSAPAEDIDVALDFPDGFEVRDEEDMPGMPDEPAEPVRPSDDSAAPLFKLPDLSRLLRDPANPLGGLTRPTIRKTNSYRVTLPPLQRLKHGCEEALPLLYAVFPTFSAMKSFGVRYEISSATLPDKVCGELHVEVRASS